MAWRNGMASGKHGGSGEEKHQNKIMKAMKMK
jgi:hypothetical protein